MFALLIACQSWDVSDRAPGVRSPVSATCDDEHPCLPGYFCPEAADCDTPGCGYCFEA